MKGIQRLLSLLLVLLLVAAVLPTSAYASDVCPRNKTGKHSWSNWKTTTRPSCTEAGVQTRQCSACKQKQTQPLSPLGHAWDKGKTTLAATCTEAGVQTYTCSRCRSTLEETVPAVGHFWDEGVVIREPQGFTPGEKSYTCLHCGEKKTEALDPTGSLFNSLHNVTRSPEISDLVITEDPQGDYLPEGGPWTVTLHVKAEGGVEPYSYQWYYEPVELGVGAGTVADLVKGQGGALAEAYARIKGKTRPAAAGWQGTWMAAAGILGTPLEKPENEGTTLGDLFARPIEGATSDTYETGVANRRYWCVVTDTASGQTAVSAKAEVLYAVYILVQPRDKNLYGLSSVDLTCTAAGGSGGYLYSLVDVSDGRHQYVAQSSDPRAAFAVSAEGEYAIEVDDIATGSRAVSHTVRVYSSETDRTPVITKQPEAEIWLDYREDGAYTFPLSCEARASDGDTEHLQYLWCREGSGPIGEGQTIVTAYGPGVYYCVVTDARALAEERAVTRNVLVAVTLSAELTGVTAQGSDSPLNRGEDARITFTVRGGQAQYFVTFWMRCFFETDPVTHEGFYQDYRLTASGNGDILGAAGEHTALVHFYRTQYAVRDGQSYLADPNVQFFLVVTDALDQRAETGCLGADPA